MNKKRDQKITFLYVNTSYIERCAYSCYNLHETDKNLGK